MFTKTHTILNINKTQKVLPASGLNLRHKENSMSIAGNKNPNVQQLAELAMEIERKDNLDWGMLQISEQQAFELMASNVLEQFSTLENDEEAAVIALATITKLLVENFVLNLQLKGAENVKAGL